MSAFGRVSFIGVADSFLLGCTLLVAIMNVGKDLTLKLIQQQQIMKSVSLNSKAGRIRIEGEEEGYLREEEYGRLNCTQQEGERESRDN